MKKGGKNGGSYRPKKQSAERKLLKTLASHSPKSGRGNTYVCTTAEDREALFRDFVTLFLHQSVTVSVSAENAERSFR